MPEREVVAAAAAAAAATTAARDLRPESSWRRRQLQRLAPGPLVSRTRARVEQQSRRGEARLGSANRPSGALPSFFVPALGTAALIPLPAGRESPAVAAARIAPCGRQRIGRGSLPAHSVSHLGCGPSGAGAWGRADCGAAVRGGGARPGAAAREGPERARRGEGSGRRLCCWRPGSHSTPGERRGSHSRSGLRFGEDSPVVL